jgi:hypothetical protein
MGLLWSLLVCGSVGHPGAEQAMPLRYLKPAGGRYVLESEVTRTTTENGSTYVSRTVRGPETLTLTVYRDSKGRIVGAVISRAV